MGAELKQMERAGAWRFINPPVALTEGLLVDRSGRRICNEELYGATIGAKIADEHHGEGYLVFDQAVWDRVFADIRQRRKLNFQYTTALLMLFINRRKASDLNALSSACLMPRGQRARTVAAYNERAEAGVPDALGKSKDRYQPLTRPPYYAVDCSIANFWFPTPCITLGGLIVEGLTGEVRRGDVVDDLC